MKRISIVITLSLLFVTTSCSSPKQKLVRSHSGGNGGNPEVNNINRCFQFKDKERNRCLNNFYPQDNINIMIYPYNGTTIKLAGRKSSIEKKELDLQEIDRLMLYIDISNVRLPIRCNIKEAILTRDKKSLVVDVKVLNLKKSLILTDKNKKTLLDYTIKK